MTKTTTGDKIIATLRRGPKRGLTAEEIVTRAKAPLPRTRTLLSEFKKQDTVAVVGTTASGRGRPANRYALAAS